MRRPGSHSPDTRTAQDADTANGGRRLPRRALLLLGSLTVLLVAGVSLAASGGSRAGRSADTARPPGAVDSRASRRPDQPVLGALHLRRRAERRRLPVPARRGLLQLLPHGRRVLRRTPRRGLAHLQGPRAGRHENQRCELASRGPSTRSRRRPRSLTPPTVSPWAAATGEPAARHMPRSAVRRGMRMACSPSCSRSNATGASGGAAAHSTSRARPSGRSRSRRAIRTRRTGRMRCQSLPTGPTRSTHGRSTPPATRQPPRRRPAHDFTIDTTPPPAPSISAHARSDHQQPRGDVRLRRLRTGRQTAAAGATARALPPAPARSPTARWRSAHTALKSRPSTPSATSASRRPSRGRSPRPSKKAANPSRSRATPTRRSAPERPSRWRSRSSTQTTCRSRSRH